MDAHSPKTLGAVLAEYFLRSDEPLAAAYRMRQPYEKHVAVTYLKKEGGQQ